MATSNVSHHTKAETADDLRSWLTREQIADVLGISNSTLTRLKRMGYLHPRTRRSDYGLRMIEVFDPQELPNVPQRHRRPIPNEAGETTARVFSMLEDGRNIREIVIELRETFSRVEELREQWLDAGGQGIVLTPAIRKEAEQIAGRPISTATDMLAALRDLAARNGNTSTAGGAP